MKRVWLLIPALAFATACNDAPTTTTGDTPQLSQVPRTNTHLVGTFTYYTEAVHGRQVLQNNVYPADVLIEFLGGNDARVTLTEFHGTFEMAAHITPSGSVVMEYTFPAAFLVDVVQAHSGCSVSGPFPVYHGWYDGTRMVVATTWNSLCPVHWDANDIFPTPVDGPVQWSWTIDATVAP